MMMRSHAVICVDRNGNESRREISARDWPDCFQRALSAGGTWQNFVRFIAADDPFKRVDRPGSPPPPALGKLADAMEAAQVKAEKPQNQPSTFSAAPRIRMPRGQLAALFARMLPQMPETFSRLELEKRAFDSTGERYDDCDSGNALQFLKEKKIIYAAGRGRYRIPDDVRQGQRTLVAQIRVSPDSIVQSKLLAPPQAQKITTGTASITTTQTQEDISGEQRKDASFLVRALANALVLSDVEQDEKAITGILEAITGIMEAVTSFEVIVRRHQKAIQVRKELLAAMG